ncbi:hypothetical protein POTOM_047362 [Populus tomentosa]|uniref:glucan endo-1,3-beta-D-glucosidase n=1 Tax=Populus tomentosa TaxID=118781 RepID=A0A8X7YSC7_POPTO|nr:hypothetical protein POTOM_047362 [Populus tomentosa]
MVVLPYTVAFLLLSSLQTVKIASKFASLSVLIELSSFQSMKTKNVVLFCRLKIDVGSSALIFAAFCADSQSFIGINYGQLEDNLPPPSSTAKLLQSTSIQKVRLYGSDPAIIIALANTGIGIVIGTANGDIPGLASDPNFAKTWINTNVLPFYPASNIILITVGNEVMTSNDQNLMNKLLPAMQNVQNALNDASLGGKIKVTTVHSMGVLKQSEPPSSGSFDPSYGDLMKGLLEFNSATGSPFAINPYPYFAYRSDTRPETPAFCLFQPNAGRMDGNTKIKYMNMFDAQVRLYGSDPAIIKALANTGIGIVTGTANGDIPGLASDPNFAKSWINTNVLPFFPASNIILITVGNEVMNSNDQNLMNKLLRTRQNVPNALNDASLGGKIKVSTVHSMGLLKQSEPPSSRSIDQSYGDLMKGLLEFNCANGDAQVDAVYSALNSMGFKNVEIVVAETGWPFKGDDNDVGPSIENAKAYNGNLIAVLRSMVGTPLIPGKSVDTYLFALYDGDSKPGPGSERSFGLLKTDLTMVYDAGLSTSSQSGVSDAQLQANLDFACGRGIDRDPIQPGYNACTCPSEDPCKSLLEVTGALCHSLSHLKW